MRSCPKLVEREALFTRRQRTFSFWDHHTCYEGRVCLMDTPNSSFPHDTNQWTLLFIQRTISSERLGTDMVCSLLATPYLDGAGSMSVRFRLLLFHFIASIILETSRIRSTVSIRNWKQPLFRFCKKLYPQKYCWPHNQWDPCPVNMASRLSDLGSPTGQCKIELMPIRLALRGDFWGLGNK